MKPRQIPSSASMWIRKLYRLLLKISIVPNLVFRKRLLSLIISIIWYNILLYLTFFSLIAFQNENKVDISINKN